MVQKERISQKFFYEISFSDGYFRSHHGPFTRHGFNMEIPEHLIGPFFHDGNTQVLIRFLLQLQVGKVESGAVVLHSEGEAFSILYEVDKNPLCLRVLDGAVVVFCGVGGVEPPPLELLLLQPASCCGPTQEGLAAMRSPGRRPMTASTRSPTAITRRA